MNRENRRKAMKQLKKDERERKMYLREKTDKYLKLKKIQRFGQLDTDTLSDMVRYVYGGKKK